VVVSRDGRPKDLRLVKGEPPSELLPADVGEVTRAVRAALDPAELDPADHEALLALTLGDDVAGVSDQERAAAELLRDALDGRGAHPLAELATALRCANEATAMDLDDLDHETLIAVTLGDEAAALAAEQQAEAALLCRALEGENAHPLAELATAARHAHGAGDGRIDQLTHERLLRKAGVVERAPSKKERRLSTGMIIGAVASIAAGVALFLGSMQWLESQSAGGVAVHAPAELINARSTQDLFDPAEPFPQKGGESDRLGKIVASRQADLRANRFAAWGVR
jgi:hypothetical protein